MTISCFFHLLKHRLWSTSEALLLVRPANKPLPPQTWKPCTIELRLATPETVQDCGDLEDASLYAPIYLQKLADGDILHFGYLNGKCVYRHAAQCQGDIFWDGVLVRHLTPKEIHTYFSLCAPEARGHGVQTESLRQMFLMQFDCTAYTEVVPDNKASLVSCFRAGYEVHSLLTVKNRFLRRTLTEKRLTPQEASRYYC